MEVIEVQHDFFHSDIDWADVTERKEVKVVRVIIDNGNVYVSTYFTADDLRVMLQAIEDAEKIGD